MNIKRFLPLIVLILVSVAVFLCALGVIFVLSVDAKTPAEKIQSMLTLGIPSGTALLVLLWFGAGMDQVLARLKQRSTRISVSVLTYIFVPIFLCIGLPALAGFTIYAIFNTSRGWQQLPALPELAVEIAAASRDSVVVRSESGSHFYCWTSAPADCWDATDKPQGPVYGEGQVLEAAPGSQPPGEVVSLLGISYSHMGVEGRTYFAAVQDGSVWYLQQDNNKYEAGFLSGLFLTIALIPAIAGLLVIYLGAGISALTRRLAATA